MAELFRLALTISGRVQGVFFRESACEEAKTLGLTGTARNQPDGTVSIVAEGPRDILEIFKAWCAQGPELARVEKIDGQWEEISERSHRSFTCPFH